MTEIKSIKTKKNALEFLKTININQLLDKKSNQQSMLHEVLLHIFDYDLLGSSIQDINKGLAYIPDDLIKKEIMSNPNEHNILIDIINGRTSNLFLKHILKELDDELIQSKGFQYVLNYEKWGIVKTPNAHDKIEWTGIDFIIHFYNLINSNPKTEKHANKLYLNYFIQFIQEDYSYHIDEKITATVFEKIKEKKLSFTDINKLSQNTLKTQTPNSLKSKSFMTFLNLFKENISLEEQKIFNPWFQALKKEQDLTTIRNLKYELAKEKPNQNHQDFIKNYYAQLKTLLTESNLSLSTDCIEELKIHKRFLTKYLPTEINDSNKTSKNDYFQNYNQLTPDIIKDSFDSKILIEAATIVSHYTGLDLTETLKTHFKDHYISDVTLQENLNLAETLHLETLHTKPKHNPKP